MTFSELISSDKPILIDFYAEWCGPCKGFDPILQKLKKEVGDTAQIVKIDVDKNQELSNQLGVQSIPTVMIFKNGELKWREVGSQSLQTLKERLVSLNAIG